MARRPCAEVLHPFYGDGDLELLVARVPVVLGLVAFQFRGQSTVADVLQDVASVPDARLDPAHTSDLVFGLDLDAHHFSLGNAGLLTSISSSFTPLTTTLWASLKLRQSLCFWMKRTALARSSMPSVRRSARAPSPTRMTHVSYSGGTPSPLSCPRIVLSRKIGLSSSGLSVVITTYSPV